MSNEKSRGDTPSPLVDSKGPIQNMPAAERPEGKKWRNYHLTWLGAGQSVGVTEKEPGHYSPDELHHAEMLVAPGAFVEKYIQEHENGQFTDGAIEAAILAWEAKQREPSQ